MIPYDFEYWEMRGKQNIMKITEATEQDKIKALAELDGWKVADIEDVYELAGINPCTAEYDKLPNYLISYDAIIPLVQKQEIEIRRDVYRNLIRDKSGKIRYTVDIGDAYMSTPQQLADALLIATGKFEI